MSSEVLTDSTGPRNGARIALFGTSRLHRPFARQAADGPRLNYASGEEPIFARMGYFHGASEIAQRVENIVGARDIPSSIMPFAFRVENRATTPMNGFDSSLAAAIRGGLDFSIDDPGRIRLADAIAVEVSSLRANVHRETNTMLHTNPNFLHNVSYSAIYPDGYYGRYAPWLGVEVVRESVEMVSDALRRIRVALPGTDILVLGHLASESAPQGGRLAQNGVVSEAAQAAGAKYVDLAPFVDEYGFAEVDGRVDYHHLSLAGEDALGQHLLDAAAGRL